MTNSNLHNAKRNKNDEFFTRYEDIEKEVANYKEHLKGKYIYCNCDDYRLSNFVKFFVDHFKEYGLKKLTSTNYDNGRGAFKYVYDGNTESIEELKGNGDFRSEECIELLKQADIVVTNPPFSLFREYVAQLMEYGKKFLVIGNYNAVTFKEIFPLIKNNKLWLGTQFVKEFVQPDGTIKKFGNICWFTNLDHKKRNTKMDFYKKYAGHEDEFPKYDNYDAIECSKVADIPEDYNGVIGVPITFLDKYCPEQFEIIGHEHDLNGNGGVGVKGGQFEVNGKGVYKRILIRFKR